MNRRPRVAASRCASTRTGAAMLCVLGTWILLGGCATATLPASDTRPVNWATPVAAAGVPNLYRVNASLYRSAQPTRDAFAALDKGAPLVPGDTAIRTILSLRASRTDDSLAARPSTVHLEHVPVYSWHVDDEDVVRFLRSVTDPAIQPVLVHCRRGADRTGLMVAIYRVVVEDWTKSAAIDEMTHGGYGFRPVWQNIIRYIEDLDVDAIRAQTAAAR